MRAWAWEAPLTGRIDGKVCVVTGAGGAIGRAVAVLFAREGARLALADVDTTGLATVLASVTETGADAAAFVVDVTDPVSVEALYAGVNERFGRIDVCLNNAAVLAPDDTDPVTTPLSTWQRVIAVNQTGVFLCLKYQLPYLVRQGAGSIINTASMVALQGSATPQVAYDASKGALITLSRDVAVTYADRGVRCNALCPGPIETPMFRTIFGADQRAARRRLIHSPTGRFGRAEEVAYAALFLASDESSFVNATAMLVDGGITYAYTTPGDEAP